MSDSGLQNSYSFIELWAIQLDDSDYRAWKHENGKSYLTFDWQQIKAGVRSNINDISIAVAQAHPDYTRRRVKAIVDGIYRFSRLSKGAGILGVKGDKSIEKVGVIQKVDIDEESNRKINLSINWITKLSDVMANKPLFKTDLEIRKIKPGEIEYLNLPITLKYDGKTLPEANHYEQAESFDNTMIYALNEKAARLEVKEDSGGEIEIFFGTNRARVTSVNPNEVFTDDLDDLHVGKCTVSIPKGHVQGEIERPLNMLFFDLPERITKHVVLKNIEHLSHEDFFSNLSIDIGKFPERAALIFIHGYNNTFVEAARRTAQIAWDIPFNGMAGFYSWPSSGRTLDYAGDIERADASLPKFQEFIEKILLETCVEKLHLVAHSMGNRLLTATLNDLSDKTSLAAKLKIINQIVLAAPDLDQDVFRNNILPKFKSVGLARTLYSSDADEALRASKIVRGGRPRLGDAGNELFVESGLDTIDASNVDSYGNGHSYIFDTKELLTDLFYLLGKGLSPRERRLRARKKINLTYWLFPK